MYLDLETQELILTNTDAHTHTYHRHSIPHVHIQAPHVHIQAPHVQYMYTRHTHTHIYTNKHTHSDAHTGTNLPHTHHLSLVLRAHPQVGERVWHSSLVLRTQLLCDFWGYYVIIATCMCTLILAVNVITCQIANQ